MKNDNNDRDRTKNYQVGYRRPPKKTRFKKGRSGNPAGRPKGARSLKSSFMSELTEKIPAQINGQSRMISKRDALAKQIVNKAAMGHLPSVKFIAEFLADSEARDEQEVNAHNDQSARERFKRKIDEMAARIRARHGLPPEDG